MIASLLVVATPSIYALPAPQSLFGFPIAGLNPFLQAFQSTGFNQLDRNSNIFDRSGKDSGMSDAASDGLLMIDEFKNAATPLLAEMTKAVVPSIQKYTEKLQKFNKDGGDFPIPPLDLFRYGRT